MAKKLVESSKIKNIQLSPTVSIKVLETFKLFGQTCQIVKKVYHWSNVFGVLEIYQSKSEFEIFVLNFRIGICGKTVEEAKTTFKNIITKLTPKGSTPAQYLTARIAMMQMKR
jgi:hypothetical protein